MPEPEELGRIIDRACQLAEEAIGHSPDPRDVAEKVIAWVRVLWPLREQLR